MTLRDEEQSLAFLEAMRSRVARIAERNQILFGVRARMAAELFVVDFETCHRAAELALRDQFQPNGSFFEVRIFQAACSRKLCTYLSLCLWRSCHQADRSNGS
jgi:hypothetical protein